MQSPRESTPSHGSGQWRSHRDGTRGSRRRTDWATKNRVVLDLDTMRLRDFSRSATAATPVLVDTPYAGHNSTIADYARGQRLVETLLGAGLERLLATDWKSATRRHEGLRHRQVPGRDRRRDRGRAASAVLQASASREAGRAPFGPFVDRPCRAQPVGGDVISALADRHQGLSEFRPSRLARDASGR